MQNQVCCDPSNCWRVGYKVLPWGNDFQMTLLHFWWTTSKGSVGVESFSSGVGGLWYVYKSRIEVLRRWYGLNLPAIRSLEDVSSESQFPPLLTALGVTWNQMTISLWFVCHSPWGSTKVIVLDFFCPMSMEVDMHNRFTFHAEWAWNVPGLANFWPFSWICASIPCFNVFECRALNVQRHHYMKAPPPHDCFEYATM